MEYVKFHGNIINQHVFHFFPWFDFYSFVFFCFFFSSPLVTIMLTYHFEKYRKKSERRKKKEKTDVTTTLKNSPRKLKRMISKTFCAFTSAKFIFVAFRYHIKQHNKDNERNLSRFIMRLTAHCFPSCTVFFSSLQYLFISEFILFHFVSPSNHFSQIAVLGIFHCVAAQTSHI